MDEYDEEFVEDTVVSFIDVPGVQLESIYRSIPKGRPRNA
jgi:hypothetical protein